jgi:hypothetical protein
MDKLKMKDSMGRALTQSLFLECGYNTQHAIFTLNDEDKEYKGKTYISLKRLFLEAEDPIEYEFAKQYLLGWQHWQRLNKNKMLSPIFEEWREELELSIRSAAVKGLIDESVTGEKPFQAQKWLADKGWSKNHKEAMEDRIRSEFDEDFARMDKAGIDAKRTMVN